MTENFPQASAWKSIADPGSMLQRSIFLQGEEPPYDKIYVDLFDEVKAGS